MLVRRLLTALTVLSVGMALGSCSSFSGYVSDHWPHWAGGMPDDVPPRRGAPGYDDFIAHKQQETDAAKAAASGDRAPAAPAVNPPADGRSAVQGGLY
jgi:hypothetical protein